jgi:hypothetical protein
MSERSTEWVLERVRKLLALGTNAGATEGERDNAMRMAHALLAKYNLDMAQVQMETGEVSEDRRVPTISVLRSPLGSHRSSTYSQAVLLPVYLHVRVEGNPDDSLLYRQRIECDYRLRDVSVPCYIDSTRRA